jgi:carboxypeptidase C (cathepsin A)
MNIAEATASSIESAGPRKRTGAPTACGWAASALVRGALWALCLSLALRAGPVAAAEDEEEDEAKPAVSAPAAAKKAAVPVPKEASTASRHQVTISGADIGYTATAGNLVIRKGDDPVASMFYVAYTRDDVKDVEKRPVTFFYNGGPGSSTLWLHMGSFGPRVVETANAQATGPAPFRLSNNPDSLLDRSDLVFVDAVSTGFSKVVGKGKGKDFYGVDGDVDAFAKFITRYVTQNHRWNSPKFLFGESYGTLRSCALAYRLQQQGLSFNGIILLSTVMDYSALVSPVLDQPIEDILPTYAAIAYYHDKLPRKPADLQAFLQEVRDYAAGEYAQALSKGQYLPDAQRDAVAARLHEYTGLSVGFIKEANLRVGPGRFRKELLRDEGRTVGRYDGRFEGIDFDAAGETATYDASEAGIKGAFTAAFNNYLVGELNYTHDTPYQVSSTEFSVKDWDFHHKLPEYMNFPLPYPFAFVINDLGQAMRENPHLKVLSANGLFDLATPFFGTERCLNHMGLDPSLRGNLTFAYYPSGHMVYLNPEAHKAFKADLAKFYDSATQP